MSATPLAASAAHAQLRAALRGLLAADAALAALLGGPVLVHDEAPRAAPGPVLVFGATILRDRSGQDAPLLEHRLDLDIWSPGGTSRPALEIVETIAARLDTAALTMPHHRLVALHMAETSLDRDGRSQRIRARLRLVALTQPLAALP
jgi:hypothetical protein